MKEALRVHPAVGFPLERYVPPEGVELCGHSLPGGTNVSVSAPVIHMNREIYGEDAEEFRPERWLEASPDQLKLMDRCFLAVRKQRLSDACIKLLTVETVWTWLSHLHREEHIDYGNVQVCATITSTF